MERRLAMRGQFDFPVIQHVDGFPHECRCVDISANGMVIQRTKSLQNRAPRLYYWVEIPVDQGQRVHALARPVWSKGPLMAMRYVAMNEVDQLEIAELVDRHWHRGAVLH
jgi:hypothetical protein